MSDDLLKYDEMVERALRAVVRTTLAKVAEHGLPGSHQLYISFLTRHPGVEIADHLCLQYPNDMTIVLEHQFWGLEVEDDAFEVSLSFNDIQERLHISFDAIVGFADPSVNFALQFQKDQPDIEVVDDAKKPLLTSDIIQQPDIKLAPSEEELSPQSAVDSSDESSGPEDNVVALETFRKK